MKKNYKLGFSLIEISVVVLIIGVLIAAITTGTDLVKRSKLASARNLSANSSIYGMGDLVLWLESSLPTSFQDAGEGEGVVLWSNNSPFYNIGSAIMDGSTDVPMYIKDAINHIPSVRFSGLCDAGLCEQYLNVPSIARLLEETDLTIFILEKRDAGNPTAERRIISTSNGDGAISGTGLNIYYNTSDQLAVTNASGASTLDVNVTSGPSLHYLTLFNDADFEVNDNIILRQGFNYYRNQRLPESGPMPAATALIEGGGDVRFATQSMGDVIRIGDSDHSYIGNLSEVIIFNRRLRQREMIDIFNYFEAKYNIVLSDS
ncbi:MAG: prepilin-type N-terminal cleavage/methylation domain-containing protein [Rickettsiales bacterium]|jgi:prepilin-type N-terminal cleavage/methylation domain-containing protein